MAETAIMNATIAFPGSTSVKRQASCLDVDACGVASRATRRNRGSSTSTSSLASAGSLPACTVSTLPDAQALQATSPSTAVPQVQVTGGCVLGTPSPTASPPKPIPGPVIGIPSLPSTGAGFVPMPPHMYLAMIQQQQAAMASAMMYASACMPGMMGMGMGMPGLPGAPMTGNPMMPGGDTSCLPGIQACNPFAAASQFPWATNSPAMPVNAMQAPLPFADPAAVCSALPALSGQATNSEGIVGKPSFASSGSPKADSATSSQDCVVEVDLEFASFIDSFFTSGTANIPDHEDAVMMDLPEGRISEAPELELDLGDLIPGNAMFPTEPPLGLSLCHDAVLDAMALAC